MSRRRRRRRSGILGPVLALVVLAVLLSAHIAGSGPHGSGSCSGIGQVPASMINGAARNLGISCKIVRAQISQESGGINGQTSSAGAMGVAQFEAKTWQADGCQGSWWDIGDSMTCYVTEMRNDLRNNGGNLRDALAAYNAGQGRLYLGYGYADAIMAAA